MPTIDKADGVILRVKSHFGFIGIPSWPDVYFRMADLRGFEPDVPLEGRRVTCEIRRTPKGFLATNIRPAK